MKFKTLAAILAGLGLLMAAATSRAIVINQPSSSDCFADTNCWHDNITGMPNATEIDSLVMTTSLLDELYRFEVGSSANNNVPTESGQYVDSYHTIFGSNLVINANLRGALREEIVFLQEELIDWPNDGSVRTLTYRELERDLDGNYVLVERTETMLKEQVVALVENLDMDISTLNHEPARSLITYVGETSISCMECYLSIIDGDSVPNFYIFDISGWDGTEIISIQGFWPTQSVAIWGVSTSVPAPATLSLMGLGLVGLGFARRRKAA